MAAVTWQGAALQLPGGTVLLGPRAVRVAAVLLRRGVEVTSRCDGITPPPWLTEVVRVVESAAAEVRTTERGSPAVPRIGGPSVCVSTDDLDAAEVATLLGCQSRNVRDLATRGALPARKIGGRWLFARGVVETYTRHRTRERTRDHE
jgi:excisionase family DNA binding protein